ncbi:MAG: hypothetical protein K9W45_07635 [Candidatus Heimdallarchaeum aukensis]|uniref:Uncharacterized protein n=1 Tax=Candidatus Heimdallarchaeum aukensis TaxID=2876573 RepID=A0A9Y1FKA6_9ARCH|nr:MAG: hypothetical protein K9W45_07635 [Candidatus Heimdallarchaeum aukensis]
MVTSLYQFLKQLKRTFITDNMSSQAFIVEFAPTNEERLKALHVSGILVTPYFSNSNIGFMLENKLNLVLKAESIPFAKAEKGQLIDKEYELIRTLAINNIITINISRSWLFKTGFQYFLNTIGMNYLDEEPITLHNSNSTIFSVSPISFDEFMTSLSHLSKNWVSLDLKDDNSKLIVENPSAPFTIDDIFVIKDSGVDTVISFHINSQKLPLYKKANLNLIYLNHIDYLNILLRKLAQTIQLDVEIPTLFLPQDSIKLKTPHDYDQY